MLDKAFHRTHVIYIAGTGVTASQSTERNALAISRDLSPPVLDLNVSNPANDVVPRSWETTQRDRVISGVSGIRAFRQLDKRIAAHAENAAAATPFVSRIIINRA